MTKKTQEKIENLKGAALLMERLFQTGVYQAHKQAETHLKSLVQSIKAQHPDDQMRKEFMDVGVVAKYVRAPVFDTDMEGLMEYLSDLGILIPSY